MKDTLTRNETWSLLVLVVGCLGVITNTFQGDGEPLIASLALSGIAFAATFSLTRWLGGVFVKAGLKGRDMAKLRHAEMYGLHWSADPAVFRTNITDNYLTDQKRWELFAPLFIYYY